MLFEMVADGPELLDEAKAWPPKFYETTSATALAPTAS